MQTFDNIVLVVVVVVVVVAMLLFTVFSIVKNYACVTL